MPEVSAKATACIISFNEEQNIRACLESVQFCDEILVVDSHSTDRTREIALELGARVIERDWPGHIEQKNFAINQAKNDWVLCLDCDERVTPSAREKIVEVLKAPEFEGYGLNRRNIYLGGWVRYGGWYPDRKVRLFKRSSGRWAGENPHDHVTIPPPGRSAPLHADLEHLTYKDIGDHLKTIGYFGDIAAAEKLAKGQRWVGLNLLFNPPLRFVRMFVFQRGFLDGWRGFLVAAMAAVYVLVRYAKLWELIHVKGQRRGEGGKVSYGRRGADQH